MSLLGWGAFAVPFVLGALAAELWFGLMRRSAIIPISGGALVFIALLAIAQHYQRGEPAIGEGAGGVVGATVANIATGAFGDVGGPIALIALLLVGVVITANRTLGDLIRPAWEDAAPSGRASACLAARPDASDAVSTRTRTRTRSSWRR